MFNSLTSGSVPIYPLSGANWLLTPQQNALLRKTIPYTDHQVVEDEVRHLTTYMQILLVTNAPNTIAAENRLYKKLKALYTAGIWKYGTMGSGIVNLSEGRRCVFAFPFVDWRYVQVEWSEGWGEIEEGAARSHLGAIPFPKLKISQIRSSLRDTKKTLTPAVISGTK